MNDLPQRELGFRAQATRKSPRVVVIGTGFGGLGMGIRLKQAGIDTFVILEKASSLGGTWRDNDYPGAACDVESHLYSFSFEKNPAWSRTFAPQKEIRAYLEHCADKYCIRSHLRFDAEVVAARFDEASNVWTVELANGERLEADIVVAATGGLSRPVYPDIPGLETFAGRLFHSARWDHTFDLAGKSVGVIGTGASAIQFVPQISGRTRELHLFQRTPPWVLPKPDRPIGAVERFFYRFVPFVQWLYRAFLYFLCELRVLGFVIHPKLMAYPERMARRYLERSVSDPALRAKLTPSYTMGCKRVLLSNDYYEGLQRPGVELVTHGIREIKPEGVVTRDGRLHSLDALILGTGFQAAEAVSPFVIRGAGGRDLAEVWRDGAEAYLGTTVAGFPNLFFIVGPNSGLGHSSMVFMIESQIGHIIEAISSLRRAGANRIEVREAAQRVFNDKIQAQMKKSVWASGCTAWYTTETGKNTTIWPSFTFVFRMLTRRVEPEHYRLTAVVPEPAREIASADAMAMQPNA